MPTTKPTCVVADDHAIVREAIVLRLLDEGFVDVVSEARNGIEAIEQISMFEPTIALIDLRMPAATGIEVAKFSAASGLATKVIIYSACVDASMVDAARAAGAHGYIAKEAPSELFAATIRAVLAGGEFIDASRPGDAAAPVLATVLERVLGHARQSRPVSEAC